jgi:hypothetical protein
METLVSAARALAWHPKWFVAKSVPWTPRWIPPAEGLLFGHLSRAPYLLIHIVSKCSRAFTMHKPFLLSVRLLFAILVLVAILCFAGPFGWPKLDFVALSLVAMGACLGVLIVLLPWVRR